MLKLNIGCGLNYKKDYINIDAYDDTVADVITGAENLDYPDESVDLIESYQLIEHLGYVKTLVTLGEWFRVLKKNSSLILETPDIDKTFESYLKSNDHSHKAIFLNWIYGFPVEGYEHKFCFSAGLLRKLLIEAGFVDIMEKYHEKTFGVPTYNFIAKKPVNVNPNYQLIHNFRKRCFNEISIFNTRLGENYKLDFEKNVLRHTVDYVPRDFSVITFNEIFTNSVTYSIESAKILIEESEKLNIISEDLLNKIRERLIILEDHNLNKFLFSNWEENLLNISNPNKAFLMTSEIAKNIAKSIMFEVSKEEFENHIKQNMTINPSILDLKETCFSYMLLENVLSRIFARYIKGIASEEELKICKALANK